MFDLPAYEYLLLSCSFRLNCHSLSCYFRRDVQVLGLASFGLDLKCSQNEMKEQFHAQWKTVDFF